MSAKPNSIKFGTVTPCFLSYKGSHKVKKSQTIFDEQLLVILICRPTCPHSFFELSSLFNNCFLNNNVVCKSPRKTVLMLYSTQRFINTRWPKAGQLAILTMFVSQDKNDLSRIWYWLHLSLGE